MVDIAATLNNAVASLPTPNYLVSNLTLQFNISSGNSYSVDSAGNEVKSGAAIIIEASVVAQQQKPTDMALPGSGQSALRLKGRLTNPKYLPDGVSFEDQCFATYIDTESGTRITGKARFLPATQARVSEITRKFGQRIDIELISAGVG